jgi:F-type H+-transporting ATPase subunit b
MGTGMSSDGLVILLDKFGIDVPLLCIQIANFALVAYLLYRFGFRSVLRTMDERNRQISDGLEYAKKMQSELRNIETKRSKLIAEANSQAGEIVRMAQDRATELDDRQRAESKKFAEDTLAKARVEIANERKLMFSGLKGDLKELVIEAAKRALNCELSDDDRISYGKHAVEMLTKTDGMA